MIFNTASYWKLLGCDWSRVGELDQNWGLIPRNFPPLELDSSSDLLNLGQNIFLYQELYTLTVQGSRYEYLLSRRLNI